MEFIINILITALVLFISAKLMPKVALRSFGAAIVASLLIAVISFLTGWLLSLVLHVATLGIFYVLGLSFIIRTVVLAIVIEITEKLMSGFSTRGFLPSLWLAVILGLAGLLTDNFFIHH